MHRLLARVTAEDTRQVSDVHWYPCESPAQADWIRQVFRLHKQEDEANGLRAKWVYQMISLDVAISRDTQLIVFAYA